MLRYIIITSMLPLFIIATGCRSSNNNKSQSSEPVLIGEYLASNDEFSRLHDALEVTQLLDVLFEEEGNITFFAPNNDAFDKVDPLTLDLLFNQAESSEDGSGILRDILLHHIILNIELNLAQIEAELGDNESYVTPETEYGESLEIEMSEDNIVVNGQIGSSVVTQADILSINGVLHSLDALLNPTDSVFPANLNYEEGEESERSLSEELDRIGDDISEEADRVEEDVSEEADRL